MIATAHSRARKGFTMLEMIVVVAIVGLLAAIIFPAIARSKLAAYVTAHTSQLRQVGMAHALYEESTGWQPLATVPLVRAGVLDRRLVASSLDPFPQGAANLYRSHSQEHAYTQTDYQDSTFCLAEMVGADLRAKVLESRAAGWAAVQSEPPRQDSWLRDTEMYSERYLRLRLDGSVVARPRIWKPRPNGNYFTSSLWYFTDDTDLFPFGQ